MHLIFGDDIEIQREKRSWIKIPQATIYVNGSKDLGATDEGFYDLSERIFRKLVEDPFSYYVLIYNSPECAFVLPSPRVREIFEGNPFFQIEDSEWGFNIYQNEGKHFLKLKGITDKEYDIEGYRDKWEQIAYFRNKPRLSQGYESLREEPSIWIRDIARAFRKLGGINSFHPLSALYLSIEEIRKEDKVNLPINYKAIVRYYLETNSRGSGKDLFEPREIGSGYWKIKDNNPRELGHRYEISSTKPRMKLDEAIELTKRRMEKEPYMLTDEQNVIAKYGSMFEMNNLDYLTADGFTSFLLYENNKHWTSLHRQGKLITSNMEKLRSTLRELLDESRPINERIDNVLPDGKSHISGLGKAILTAILLVVFPKKYAVYNKVTEYAMKYFEIFPKFTGTETAGDKYLKINTVINDIANRNRLSLWQMDHVWDTLSHDKNLGYGKNLGYDENGNYTLDRLISETFLEKEFFESLERILNYKKQIIIYGPPGTGKTFVAREFSKYLISKYGGGKWNLIQFHPSYTYEDFIEGIKPNLVGDNIVYRLIPGIFKEVCNDASRDANKQYILIIDEINRGQISRIFGDIIYCLEYRADEVKLPYSKDLFKIPENLILIGTMNSTDRSIAFLDYALRRRFAFYEFYPQEEILRKFFLKYKPIKLNAERIIKFFRDLNIQITKELGKEFQIGQSYFMRKSFADSDLVLIWKYTIKPLLEEYFFSDKAKMQNFEELYNTCLTELLKPDLVLTPPHIVQQEPRINPPKLDQAEEQIKDRIK